MKNASIWGKKCHHRNIKIDERSARMIRCQDCQGLIPVNSQLGVRLLKQQNKQKRASIQYLPTQTQELRRSLIDRHQALIEECGTSQPDEIVEFLDKKNEKNYAVTILENGDRVPRFAGLSLSQADFFYRWSRRNEPETQPEIEVLEPAWKLTASESLKEWMQSQSREVLEEFATRTWIELLEIQAKQHQEGGCPVA